MMLQTALPLGFLIPLLLVPVAVIAAAALVLIARGLRRRDRALYLPGFVLAGMSAMVVSLAAGRPGIDEWNPQFRAEVVYGRWADEGRTLELRADGTYTLREGGWAQTGRYELDDWNLRLLERGVRPVSAPSFSLRLRVVEADGEYRIIEQPVELDMWDGRLGYRHVPPAKVR